MRADLWQRSALGKLVVDRSPLVVLETGRQLGKTTVLAVGSTLLAEVVAGTFVVVIAPSERQSKEVFIRVKAFRASLRGVQHATKETESELRLTNGSRILVAPAVERTIRGLSDVSMLLLDECARIERDDVEGILPALGNEGQLVLASTPFAR